MNKTQLRSFLAVFALTSVSAVATEPRTPYHYSPSKVTLHGVLHQERRKAANDSAKTPVVIDVLELATPISVLADPNQNNTANTDDFPNVRKVQLFWDHGTDKSLPRPKEGQHLLVTGTLDERVAPMQFTDVTMSVAEFHITAASAKP